MACYLNNCEFSAFMVAIASLDWILFIILLNSNLGYYPYIWERNIAVQYTIVCYIICTGISIIALILGIYNKNKKLLIPWFILTAIKEILISLSVIIGLAKSSFTGDWQLFIKSIVRLSYAGLIGSIWYFISIYYNEIDKYKFNSLAEIIVKKNNLKNEEITIKTLKHHVEVPVYSDETKNAQPQDNIKEELKKDNTNSSDHYICVVCGDIKKEDKNTDINCESYDELKTSEAKAHTRENDNIIKEKEKVTTYKQPIIRFDDSYDDLVFI